ncbi:proline iminopeptidase-family hydrolase [Flaviaesturariibacter amylovorans]|uniref:Proline iminopeptidase-family hydrolase n=1 Tax=Flaviaesturariibacter amylovorans TaxID=1084520 RepID=A0ABP8HJ23_9BACT
MRFCSLLLLACLLAYSCTPVVVAGEQDDAAPTVKEYFNYGDSGVQTAGVRMIPITTTAGTFKVWTKRFGNNPRIKVLLLHGGPSFTHEYMECFESFFPKEGIEFYEYDQLGSYYSDQPKDSSLWTTERFVEEVEQVRQAIGADKNNFYILGNSWGGILGMEYALKYQQHMKGLIVANMMASIPDYVRYANEVLAPQMDPKVVAEIRDIERRGEHTSPRYQELLMPHFYAKHINRLPEWPEAVMRSMKHMNYDIYKMMQGPSEFGASGRLANWDRKADLKNISIPTLMIGAKYDTMDPKAMEAQSKMVKNGSYLFCPNGSHMSMWDDQKVFMDGVISWIRKVDGAK